MEEDLRSSGAGLRGFKSHPRHHLMLILEGFIFRKKDVLYFSLQGTIIWKILLNMINPGSDKLLLSQADSFIGSTIRVNP